MAWWLPSGRAGQMLALGVTVLVLSMAWVAIVWPLLSWHAERALMLEERAGLVRRMAALAASLPSLEARSALPAVTGALVAMGGTDAIAGADLQQRVQDMAARSGLTFASTEMLPTTMAGSHRRISLRMSSTTTWPVLVALLRSIDQATPRVLVDDLQVRGPGVIAREEPSLQVSFTVHGYRDGAAPAGQP